MFNDEQSLQQWKNDLIEYNHQRKNVSWGHFEPNKIITWKEIKGKEAEYNPILQKYISQRNEDLSIEKDKAILNMAIRKKHERLEKYQKGYDIITLDLNSDSNSNVNPHSVPDANRQINLKENYIKSRYIPSRRSDYNLITNEKLNEVYWKDAIKDQQAKNQTPKRKMKDTRREYNIITGHFTTDHKRKLEEATLRNQQKIQQDFKKTHSFNPILCKAYDPHDEEAYQVHKQEIINSRAKSKEGMLPATVLQREPVIFDFTKEKPKAVKIIEQKMIDAKKRYELRYKVEKESIIAQDDQRQQDMSSLELIKRRYQSLKDVESIESCLRKIDGLKYVEPIKNANQSTGLMNNYSRIPSWDRIVALANPHEVGISSAQSSRQDGRNSNRGLYKEKRLERAQSVIDLKRPMPSSSAMMKNSEISARGLEQSHIKQGWMGNKASNDGSSSNVIKLLLSKFKVIQTGGFNLKQHMLE